eukprot:scaffold61041_cov54-Phaeocystis_antarctica.AAC.3
MQPKPQCYPDRTHFRTRHCPPIRNSAPTWFQSTRTSHPAASQRGRCLDRKEGAEGRRRCNQHAGDGLAPAGGAGQGRSGPQTGKGSVGGRGEGTHLKHVFHAFDAGKVEVQRLVEPPRFLPSRKVTRSGVRCGLGGERAVGAVVAQAARREAARLEVGLRAHAP